MSILQSAAKIFLEQIGNKNNGFDVNQVVAALGQLLPRQGNDVDVAAIMAQLKGSGLASMSMSMLGGADKAAITPAQIAELLGQDKIQQFAAQLNLDNNTVLNGLAKVVPELMAKNAGASALMDGAKGFLGKLF